MVKFLAPLSLLIGITLLLTGINNRLALAANIPAVKSGLGVMSNNELSRSTGNTLWLSRNGWAELDSTVGKDFDGSWCAWDGNCAAVYAAPVGAPYVQIDFTAGDQLVAGFQTQGSSGSSNYWVTTYEAQVFNSATGVWEATNPSGTPGSTTFTANSDKTTIVTNLINGGTISASSVRIYPKSASGHCCMRFDVLVEDNTAYNPPLSTISYSGEPAMDAFASGLAVPYSHGSYGSSAGANTYESSVSSGGALGGTRVWSAYTSGGSPATSTTNTGDYKSWVQYNFIGRQPVKAIKIKGQVSSTQWITQYEVHASNGDGTWTALNPSSNPGGTVFTGNADGSSTVTSDLNAITVTSAVRIIPTACNVHCTAELVEVVLLDLDPYNRKPLIASVPFGATEVRGVEVGPAMALNSDAFSSVWSVDSGAFRIDSTVQADGWSALSATNTARDYVQFNFSPPRVIVGVATQGSLDSGNYWVTSFEVEVSNGDGTWSKMSPTGSPGVTTFTGNADKTTVVANRFDQATYATAIRVIPIACNNYCVMRGDVLLLSPAEQSSAKLIDLSASHTLSLSESMSITDRACDTSLDCNGNAASVSGTLWTGCVCTCTSAGFDPAQACGACSSGYVNNYPLCDTLITTTTAPTTPSTPTPTTSTTTTTSVTSNSVVTSTIPTTTAGLASPTAGTSTSSSATVSTTTTASMGSSGDDNGSGGNLAANEIDANALAAETEGGIPLWLILVLVFSSILMILLVILAIYLVQKLLKKRREEAEASSKKKNADTTYSQEGGAFYVDDDKKLLPSGNNGDSTYPSSITTGTISFSGIKTYSMNEATTSEAGGSTASTVPTAAALVVAGSSTRNNSDWKPLIVNFKKGKAIGSGAYGKVFVGMDTKIGIFMAAKEMDLQEQVEAAGGARSQDGSGGLNTLSDTQTKFTAEKKKQIMASLANEVLLMKRLQHQNIVQYFGVDSDPVNHKFYIFMEYMPGGSVRSTLDSYGAFAPSVAARYTREALIGLAYLHSERVMHRDIKGANMLLDQNGQLKLADFGCSQSVEDSVTLKGTPYWLAPEVLQKQQEEGASVEGDKSPRTEPIEVGPPSDIWSVGCTALELLTGESPFRWVGNGYAVMRIVARGGKEFTTKCIDSLPETVTSDAEVHDFILQCLKHNPADRPTAAQLLEHPWIKAAQQAMPSQLAGGAAGSGEETIETTERLRTNLENILDFSAKKQQSAGSDTPTTVAASNLQTSVDLTITGLQNQQTSLDLGDRTGVAIGELQNRPSFDVPNSLPPAAGGPQIVGGNDDDDEISEIDANSKM